MKKELFLLLISIACSFTLSAQYSITSVTPTQLVRGTSNELTVEFNQDVTSFDSVSAEIKVYSQDHFSHYYFCSEASWSGTTITITFDIPGGAIYETGTLHVTLENYINETADRITYDEILTIGDPIYALTPEICMVNTNTTGHNIIIWETSVDALVDSVVIYKETSIINDFIRIGAKVVTDTFFIDTESVNAQHANRYIMAYLDTTVTLSNFSEPHQTLHLTINSGINQTVNLIWDEYEGFDYSTFHIFRGNSNANMMKIAEVASNLFTFSDLNPLPGQQYYQIVVENPSPCFSSVEKLNANDFTLCRSNIVEHTVASANLLANNSVKALKLYPNPVADELNLNLEEISHNDFIQIRIQDLRGATVKTISMETTNSNIDVSSLQKGIYLLTVVSAERLYTEKIVKQ